VSAGEVWEGTMFHQPPERKEWKQKVLLISFFSSIYMKISYQFDKKLVQ